MPNRSGARARFDRWQDQPRTITVIRVNYYGGEEKGAGFLIGVFARYYPGPPVSQYASYVFPKQLTPAR